MIYNLDDNTSLEIVGNKARVLPDGIWHQFDINDNPQVEIITVNYSTVLIKYNDGRRINMRIVDNEITVG
jgi:hypothetical protein